VGLEHHGPSAHDLGANQKGVEPYSAPFARIHLRYSREVGSAPLVSYSHSAIAFFINAD